MRQIDTTNFTALQAPFEPGPAPMLQWIEISNLVVDDRYQRPIYGAGRTNVRRIAEAFCWSKFAPIVVSPVEGGGFAIVDGQHRATAAALRGVEKVPCQVIIADTEGQAAAFKAINGATTRMHRLSIHRAALAAGDEAAAELNAVTEAAGVTILPFPRAQDRLQAGETMAIGAIAECLRTYEREAVITALSCVTETENNKSGVLSGQMIKALCAAVASNAAWRDAGEALFRAFDEIDLEGEAEEAKTTRRGKGVGAWEVLSWRLIARLRELLGDGVAAAA